MLPFFSRRSPRSIPTANISLAPLSPSKTITPDVFISYSRRDKVFVQRLHEALVQRQRNTWVDWQDIRPTEKWWQAIEAGIEAANTFVFVISPDSVASPICRQEVDHAVLHHKRLIPVVYRAAGDQLVHPALGSHNWIFMGEGDDFAAAFQVLIQAIDTDLSYTRTHTRLLMKAIEWQRNGHDPSFLLRGKDLLASEAWLKRGQTTTPLPTDLQTQYIVTSRQVPFYRPSRRTVALTSLAVTAIVLLGRGLGLMEPLELRAFDQMVQLRPSTELPDPRLLVVEVTEADLQAQNARQERGQGTISDQSLSRVLQILTRDQPRLIGLDLARDFPADRTVPELARQLRQNDRLIALCKVPNTNAAGATIAPPVNPPPEVPSARIGFADAVNEPDVAMKIRRHLLAQTAFPDTACQATQVFSLVLARRYLELQPGASLTYTDPLTAGGSLKLGNVAFPRLGALSNGYQTVDLSGYQILLNYRATPGGIKNIAQHVTLEQVLQGQVPAAAVRDRIVLIGITAETSGSGDFFLTPYPGLLDGVTIQAHMVSQILSAVLDGRPLLQVWPLWSDALWIAGWALVGGMIVSWVRSPLKLALMGGGTIALLYLSCVGFLVFGSVWVPLLPPLVALVATGVGVVYVTDRLQTKQLDREVKL